MLALFDAGGLLVAGPDGPLARGGAQIPRVAAAIWGQQPTYVASPRRVVQAGDIALTVGEGINVARRGTDGAWRFAIALLHLDRSESNDGWRKP